MARNSSQSPTAKRGTAPQHQSKGRVEMGFENPGKRDYSQRINDPFELDRNGSDDQWHVKSDSEPVRPA
jgi:hypothetical protein